MKKTIVGVVVGLMVAAMAFAATNVVSVNVVGYNKQDVSGGGSFNLIAPGFDPIGGGDWALKDLLGTNKLTQSIVPGPADKVYLWNTAQSKWDQFFQKADGNFYDTSIPPYTTPTNPTVAVGEGFFLESVASTSRVMTMLGEVVAAGTQSVDVVPGFQALGYPFSADVMLGDMAFTNGGTASIVPGPADKIYIFENGAYVQVFMKPDNQWYRADNPPYTTPTNVNIKIGEGFWYEALNQFTNHEVSPYVGNL